MITGTLSQLSLPCVHLVCICNITILQIHEQVRNGGFRRVTAAQPIPAGMYQAGSSGPHANVPSVAAEYLLGITLNVWVDILEPTYQRPVS